MSKKLDIKTFKTIINNAPLISVDLVIKFKNRYLCGLRKNNPAKNYYFVPGGRIYKNETFLTALKRISKTEIGIDLTKRSFKFLGLYEHRYKTNTFEDQSFGTQYFVIAAKFNIENTMLALDTQHEKFCWLTKDEILSSKKVHQYTKNYFYSLAPNNKIF